MTRKKFVNSFEICQLRMKLYPYQEVGADFLSSHARALIADDAGLGKTCQLIKAVTKLDGVRNVLVLCPKSLVRNWEKEVELWGDGRSFYKIINWDKLISEKYLSDLLSVSWDVIIGDEAHMAIKSQSAIRCRAFLKLIKQSKLARVWLSTATPASNSASDYYVILKILVGDSVVGTLSSFREKFCNKVFNRFNPRGFDYKGFKNTDLLKKLFMGKVIKRRKSDVLPDLPEKLHLKVWIKFDDVIPDGGISLDEVERVFEAGGAFSLPVASVLRAVGEAKVNHAVDWVSCFPSDEPLVIFVWHCQVGEALSKRLSCPLINGSTSLACRNKYVESFQRGEVKRLICNITAGGVGLNLQNASSALFVELPWSLAAFLQAQDRVHRIGSKKLVSLYYMLAEGTIDEKVYGVLMRKLKGIKEVGI